jgi:hypothetical protein
MTRQQMLINASELMRTHIYRENRKIVPSSAAITVYRPGGDSVLVNNQPMNIAADGLLSYELSAGDNAIAAENYRVVIEYVYNTAPYRLTLFYDVVCSKLHKVVVDEDIVNELPQIRDNGWKFRGVAASGSATTITDPELARFPDDYFTGGVALSLDKNEEREITGFSSSTGTVATRPFGSAVTTDRYVLTRSFSIEIQRAFEKLEAWIVAMGKRPHLILDSSDLREVHILLSVAEVAKGLVTTQGGVWWELMLKYEKSGRDAFNALKFKYDSTVDGYLAGSESDRRFIKRSGRG